MGRLIAALSSIRHSPDRWLHRARHRRAVMAVVARLQRPRARVLVVCYGNICRSPYAAAVTRRALEPLGVPVDSAGIIGAGRRIPAHAHATALRRGADLSTHRSQLLTPALVRGASLILVMDVAQRDHLVRNYVCDPAAIVLLGDLDPEPISKRAVRDPYDQSLEVFEEVFSRIDRCGAVIEACAAAAGAGPAGPARPGDPEAASLTA
jgi:protein-tyrosine phosphatase